MQRTRRIRRRHHGCERQSRSSARAPPSSSCIGSEFLRDTAGWSGSCYWRRSGSTDQYVSPRHNARKGLPSFATDYCRIILLSPASHSHIAPEPRRPGTGEPVESQGSEAYRLGQATQGYPVSASPNTRLQRSRAAGVACASSSLNSRPSGVARASGRRGRKDAAYGHAGRTRWFR